ncbi:halocyanin domain-containing protein [Halobaculum sp. P14]|uniref:halocyanin domain-containing protein n=1 Tax=Halobaculum sp. P14 TaxID=3421638 RepID=UPI003EB8B16B
MNWSPSRRRALQGIGAATLTAAAGCVSATATPRFSDENETEQERSGAATDTPLEDWLADANGYDGTPRRYGPGSRPRIAVGEPLDDGLAFAPPVIEVPPETVVHWDWTGHGGQHNVVALDGTFDSGRTNAQPGTGYHYYFDEPGEHRYVSEPHRSDGMKGAVLVREPPKTGYPSVDDWVVDASNFDGTVVDETGFDAATIRVGAPGNGGRFAFAPPVLKVSTGTTVRWRWTEPAAPHSVQFPEHDVGTDAVFTEPGVHLSHTFHEPGTYRYACGPHRSLGMKGALIVE